MSVDCQQQRCCGGRPRPRRAPPTRAFAARPVKLLFTRCGLVALARRPERIRDPWHSRGQRARTDKAPNGGGRTAGPRHPTCARPRWRRDRGIGTHNHQRQHQCHPPAAVSEQTRFSRPRSSGQAAHVRAAGPSAAVAAVSPRGRSYTVTLGCGVSRIVAGRSSG